MPTLAESLQGKDLEHLRIIAALWGLDFKAPDARVGLARLVGLLIEKENLADVLSTLPEHPQAALGKLVNEGGRMALGDFTRRFGSLREMGAARRDREQPYQPANASPVEALWYRGLIARAFFEEQGEMQEQVYIPDELLDLIPALQTWEKLPAGSPPILGRPASAAEKANPIPAGDAILDDACTLLAALRTGLALDEVKLEFTCAVHTSLPLHVSQLKGLLAAAGLLGKDGAPLAEPVRAFLEAPRPRALLQLFEAWLRSTRFDELRQLPGLQAEGDWQNDPLRARHAVLEFLRPLPGSLGLPGDERPFWSLASFCADIRQFAPDFQRPAGSYETFHLRELSTGEFLHGFENWDKVDGYLIRYTLSGPLHWLGVLDLATPLPDDPQVVPPATAFRFSKWAGDLLNLKPPDYPAKEDKPFNVLSDGRISIPALAPRAARYQVGRFCQWDGFKAGDYIYRITPGSLEKARRGGLRVNQLIMLLRRHSKNLPPRLMDALNRWDETGSQAVIQNVDILRVRDPAILELLRKSKASRYLSDPLGPAVVKLNPGGREKVLQALAELGILGGIEE